MKIPLLISFLISALFAGPLLAQTTGTFVVADNGTHLSSCLDTNITLNDVYTQLGIRDLDDSNEDVSNYRLLELNGSVITENEISDPFKFSDYSTFFIEKKNTIHTGHTGLQIFVNIITPPTSLFKKDTLWYTVDKGAKKNIVDDFFNETTINFWNSGKDVLSLDERILFRDMSTNTELPIKQIPNWTLLGPGLYRIVYLASVCEASDIFSDTLFVDVKESLCQSIQLNGTLSFCRDEIADIRSFIYVGDHVATSIELADMTFYNRSNSASAGSVIDPSSVDMSEFDSPILYFPKIEIAYQPNVSLGTCSLYQYMLDTRVPTPISGSTLLVHDNYGTQRVVNVESQFYAFNNSFNKSVLSELYLNNYNVFNGTAFHFYTDAAYQNEIITEEIPAGDYYLLALNPACDEDSAKFTMNVKESDFKIIFDSEKNQGKGYYTFTTPTYPGATYEWMQWGGSIVAGLGTNEVTVYYSENASQGVFITCKITIPSPAAKISADDESTILYGAIYLKEDENKDKIEIVSGTTTGITSGISSDFASAYPNPADGVFVIDGEGEFDVKIYNAIGDLVLEQENYHPNTALQLNSKGMHFAHLTKQGKTQTIKLIIK